MLPMIKKPAVYKFIKLSGDLEFNFLTVTCLALKRVNYIERGKICTSHSTQESFLCH